LSAPWRYRCGRAKVSGTMPIEHKVRSVGTKSVTYPWLRRYVVIGPYNRRVRQDMAASVLASGVAMALGRVVEVRRRRRLKDGPPKS
jgi:hypothetical protein